MNYQENDYDNLVSLFWNNDKVDSNEFFPEMSPTYKPIPFGKYFTNDDSNNTKTTCDSNQNLTTNSLAVTPVEVFKKPKVFLIKKYVKYEEIIKEFCGEDENGSDNEKRIKKSKIAPGKRIKLIKYNNKKLSNLEKVEKLKILSKVVRRYRRKIKNIRRKIKQNSEKIWEKYLSKKIVKNKKTVKKKRKKRETFP